MTPNEQQIETLSKQIEAACAMRSKLAALGYLDTATLLDMMNTAESTLLICREHLAIEARP